MTAEIYAMVMGKGRDYTHGLSNQVVEMGVCGSNIRIITETPHGRTYIELNKDAVKEIMKAAMGWF